MCLVIYICTHTYIDMDAYIYTHFVWSFLGVRYICIYNYILHWLARTFENKCVLWTWDRRVSYTFSIYTYVGACFSSYCWHLKQIKGFFLSMWFESKNPVHETIAYVSHVILFNQIKPDALIRIALHLPYDRKSLVLFSKKETLTTSDLPPPWALNTCCGLEAISSCERGAICSGLSDL